MLCKDPCAIALAVALAVAALFGFLTGGGGSSSSSSGSGGAAGGDYSNILENDLPPDTKKDFITFEGNGSDQSALAAALAQLTPDAAGALTPGKAVQVYNTTDGYAGAASSLTGSLGLKSPTLQGGNAPGGASYDLVNNPNTNAGQTVEYGLLFAAPASLSLDDAVQQVADRVSLILENLPASNAPATPAYNYRYVVSATAASHDAPAASGQSAAANFILVTITRIPTAA